METAAAAAAVAAAAVGLGAAVGAAEATCPFQRHAAREREAPQPPRTGMAGNSMVGTIARSLAITKKRQI
jgi:hypothetical protein